MSSTSVKDASGNFSPGLMTVNSALIKFEIQSRGRTNTKFTNITYQNKRIGD
jgi:hypothetical protein